MILEREKTLCEWAVHCVMQYCHDEISNIHDDLKKLFAATYTSEKCSFYYTVYSWNKLFSLFLDFIIILFIVRSIVIWIWRVRMRQLISLIRNCEKKGLTITSRMSYHQIKSCLIHANDLQYTFGHIFIESMSRIVF